MRRDDRLFGIPVRSFWNLLENYQAVVPDIIANRSFSHDSTAPCLASIDYSLIKMAGIITLAPIAGRCTAALQQDAFAEK